MKRTVLAVVVVAALMLMVGTVFAAGGTKVCVPQKENKPIRTTKGGTCLAGYTLTELGAEGKEGPEGKEGAPGKEGKEGTPELEGKEGKEGPPGASGFAACVNADGTVRNGKITASKPKIGEFVVRWENGVFPACATNVEAQQIATVVTPLGEGPFVWTDAATSCEGNEPKITVTICNNAGQGSPAEDGFSLISLKAA